MVTLDVGLKLDFGLAYETANLIIRLPHAAMDRLITGRRATSLGI
jgi:hypothetical protein